MLRRVALSQLLKVQIILLKISQEQELSACSSHFATKIIKYFSKTIAREAIKPCWKKVFLKHNKNPKRNSQSCEFNIESENIQGCSGFFLYNRGVIWLAPHTRKARGAFKKCNPLNERGEEKWGSIRRCTRSFFL